jgi:hypothetical protein
VKMKRQLVILLCLVFSVCFSQFQTGVSAKRNKIKGYVLRQVVVNGDTLPQIDLKEVVCSAQLIFANEQDAKKYRHLVRDIRRVYPYAVLIGVKVKAYDLQMAGMSRREKKEFMKKIEPELKEQFEKIFRSNTVDQAQVLIKLVDRETGNNSYGLIKQFKGGWNAFMWQSLARIVGTNLKTEYDPEGEDKTIEHIVQQIESGAT